MTKICGKTIFAFSFPVTVTVTPQICYLVSATFPLNWMFLRLSYFEKIGRHGTDGQTHRRTDGPGATLNAAPWGRSLNKVIMGQLTSAVCEYEVGR